MDGNALDNRSSYRHIPTLSVRPGHRSIAVGRDDLAAGLGPQLPPGHHVDGILDEANASVGHHDVAAARVVAGDVLVLAEFLAATPAPEPAAGPGMLLRVRRDYRIEQGHSG